VFEVSIRLSGLINNGRGPAKSGQPILFHVPTLFRSSVAVQNDFGSTLALTLNLVAADVSPRQNNSVKRFPNREICADLRRRLRLKDSTRHLTPTLSPNSVGGEGESSSVFHEIERSF
jgi:hypothetical protein